MLTYACVLQSNIIIIIFIFFWGGGGGGGMGRSGSVVECLTRDRGVAGLSLTGVTTLCP